MSCTRWATTPFISTAPPKWASTAPHPTRRSSSTAGNDKEAGHKALRRFEEQGWRLRAVYSTHSNADHIGGNNLLAARTGCPLRGGAGGGLYAALPCSSPPFFYGATRPRRCETNS